MGGPALNEPGAVGTRHAGWVPWALWQLGVAWPLLELLGRYPEFFYTRNASPAELAGLLVVLCVALPLALLGLLALVRALAPRPGLWLYAGVVFALWLLVVVTMTPAALPPLPRALLCLLLAAGLAWAGLRTRAGRLFTLFLLPAIVVVPLLFALTPALRPLWLATPAETTAGAGKADLPIVMLVFDELPLNALLDAQGAIDRRRFPGFAALADTANWYPQATTVAASTVLAIPALLTGRQPDAFRMPHRGEYPHNLFTWLAASHRLNVSESVTVMCPVETCPPAPRAGGLRLLLLDAAAVYLNRALAPWLPAALVPPVNQSWSAFWGGQAQRPGLYTDRLAQLRDWAGRIRPGPRPGLSFIHITFPHIPYEYLPSGRRYADGWLLPGLDTPTQSWTGSDWQVRQAAWRFQLQLQALDAWLLELWDGLRDRGVFDGALVILTADHGVSFEPGANRRDAPPLDNLERNILPVPLLVKLPGQRAGAVDQRNVQSIDLVPTIAELLGQALPWAADGRSLLGPPGPGDKRAVYAYRELREFTTDAVSIAKQLAFGPQPELFLELAGADPALGPASRPELAGRALDEVAVETAADLVLTPDGPAGGLQVREDALLPAFLSGAALWPGREAFDIAVALDGRLLTVTEPWREGDGWRFAALLPEAALTPGGHALELLAVPRSWQPGAALIRAAAAGAAEQWTREPEGERLARDGAGLTLVAQGVDGAVETLSPGAQALEVLGWAFDAQHQQAVERVLFFEDERLVGEAATRMLHHRTDDYGMKINIGFHAVLPNTRLRDPSGAELAVFAVSADGRARRLDYVPPPR